MAIVATVLTVAGVTACGPPVAPPAPAPYLDTVYQANVTAKAAPVRWGAAPPIDANYGSLLYAGTGLETSDPRPALDAAGNEPLRLWVAKPSNTTTNRPAIVWVHGGGFAVGIDSMSGLANGVGKEYAQRGYVSFSVEYRIDTTLVGTQNGSQRPPSLCQWVQDNENPGDPVWEARYAQCARDVLAAQYDAQAAVRWIRLHASTYGVDPNRIAVGGFSAGSATAANLAYRSHDLGDVVYFAGDDRATISSKVQAAFGASGYEPEPASIDVTDAPVSWIHAKFDHAAPYALEAQNVLDARALGLVAELKSYCTSSLHAEELYTPNKAATDAQWTTFLARELKIYSGLRPPSADPVCP